MKKDKQTGFITDFFNNLYTKANEGYNQNDESNDFIEMINIAHQEWQSAELFFDNVSDPDLIDHAIYKLEAAKSRYVYLLKQAKKEGIKVNFY